ncbi:MAG: TAXI family TRAP transporter solute-binding subunit [Rickettsiales bacterium]
MKKALFFTLAALAAFVAPNSYAQENIMTIGTGSVTGVYYPAGGAICRLVNRGRKEHGIRCFVESTGGSIYNIRALRDGEITLGIVQSDWQYNAYRSEGVFSDGPPMRNLRSVFSLHSEMFTVAVGKNTSIKKFADLKGKKVNIGDAGSGMRETMQNLMEAQHWTKHSFAEAAEMKPTDAAKELCEGKIDAMVFAAGHPNGLIQDLTGTCGARLIPVEGPEVDKLIADNPFYARTAIPGGMYQGNPQNVPTFGVKATLVTTADADEESIYQLTKAVFDNFDSFKTLHFVFATLDKDRMVNSGLIAPMHPGALRYYREMGLIKGDAKPTVPLKSRGERSFPTDEEPSASGESAVAE